MADSLSRYRERKTLLGKNSVTLNTVLGTYIRYQNGVPLVTDNIRPTGLQPNALFEKCWDQNNAMSRGVEKRNARGTRTFRTGGPFVSIKIRVPGMELSPVRDHTWVSGSNAYRYTGSFTLPFLGFDNAILPSSDCYTTGGPNVLKDNPFLPDTSALESRAWDIKPKIEKLSMVNALYELRDLPGMLKQTSRTMKDLYWLGLKERYASDWYKRELWKQNLPIMPPRVASDFLNANFGWLPFIDDLVKLEDYLIFSKQYLDDISRGNNTWIKRKGTLLHTKESFNLGKAYTYGLEPSAGRLPQLLTIKSVDGNLCSGVTQVKAFVETKAWAEGAFKYYRPEFDMDLPDYTGIVSSVNRHITATGMRISPHHVWKSIPWSWAIDWFSNVGDLIERADAQYFDSMVAKYLYLMHYKHIRIVSYHTIFWKAGDETLVFERDITVKTRKDADSPYGFVLGGDLSATQWSILAALGLAGDVHLRKRF